MMLDYIRPFNSFVGKANYYGTHAMQNKRSMLHSVCKQLTLYDQDTTGQYVVDCSDKQSGFSIAPAAQYCSVARERVQYPHIPTTVRVPSNSNVRWPYLSNCIDQVWAIA